jgi:ABC-type phosphate/phosphonate transport system substrate-binding protein
MADYHALIFTRNNGATKRLEDLQGKMIAFEDPESTSDYVLPKMLFSKKLVQMNRLEPKVSRGELAISQRLLDTFYAPEKK